MADPQASVDATAAQKEAHSPLNWSKRESLDGILYQLKNQKWLQLGRLAQGLASLFNRHSYRVEGRIEESLEMAEWVAKPG